MIAVEVVEVDRVKASVGRLDPRQAAERVVGVGRQLRLLRALAVRARLFPHAAERVVSGLHHVEDARIPRRGFGRGEGYVKRQIEGWAEWYGKARTEDAPSYERVIGWLRERMPARESRICVIHNDFRFDNVVLGMDAERVGQFWIDRKIRGGSGPPRTVESLTTLRRVVEKLPGAIGGSAEV